MKSAGIVKMIPDASELEADPTVWEKLASSSVDPTPTTESARNSAIVRTATGMEVEIVNPTRSPRYAFAPPNRIPNTMPEIAAFRVNSACVEAGFTNGSYDWPSGISV